MAKQVSLNGNAWHSLNAKLMILSAEYGDVTDLTLERDKGDLYATRAVAVFTSGTEMNLCHRYECHWEPCDL